MIRRAKENDARKIAEISVFGWLEAYKDILSEEFLNSMSIDKKEIKAKNEILEGIMDIFVYEDENQDILGFCKFGDEREKENNCDCELYAIYVLPTVKRNGIGSKLLNFIKEKNINENKKNMCLWCLKDNIQGKSFYEKNFGVVNKVRNIEIGNNNVEEISYIFNLY